MDERVKTGVEGLDEILHGGFPPGGTYAVLGFPGTGKTILSTAYLVNGAISGERGVYVLIEEDRKRFIENLAGISWNLKKLEEDKAIKIIPYVRSIMGDVNASLENELRNTDHTHVERLREYLTVDTLYKQIKEAVDELGAKRLVIDSMTLITMLSENQSSGRLQVMWLIEKLRKLGVTTIITLEEGIGLWRDLLFLCDGVIYMMLKEKEGIFERGLVVEKVRGTDHDTGMRPIKITSEGIKVYSDELFYKASAKNRLG
jgi:KaiC/GvpD/RAD55 family RecA-like ATPase